VPESLQAVLAGVLCPLGYSRFPDAPGFSNQVLEIALPLEVPSLRTAVLLGMGRTFPASQPLTASSTGAGFILLIGRKVGPARRNRAVLQILILLTKVIIYSMFLI
jgi:hypothetical protein